METERPAMLAEMTFRSRKECGRWYPPRPPWNGDRGYLAEAVVDGMKGPGRQASVRIVDGPRLAPGETGRFVLSFWSAKHGHDNSAFQPGVRFSLFDVFFGGFVGTGVVQGRLTCHPRNPTLSRNRPRSGRP